MDTNLQSLQRRLAFQKSYSVEHWGTWRRRSLIDDAKLDTATNAHEKLAQLTSLDGEEEEKEEKEEIVVATVGKATKHYTVMVDSSDTDLSKVFSVLETFRVRVVHVESRVCKKNSSKLEMLIQFLARPSDILEVINSIKALKTVDTVLVVHQTEDTVPEQWIPEHITDLDKCTHLLTKFDPDLDSQHPGFKDEVYRKRRGDIVNIAFSYRSGQDIPRVKYTPIEIETWGHVYRHLKDLYPTHACREHREAFARLEAECGYSEFNIPQLQDVSNFLKRQTGFQLRPAAGLLTARDFLASLAFRVFQCTQYIRHSSKPDHTVEPDCVHELLGHVPMLSDPGFAEFSQEIGLASLGASDQDIERFATLYWFTVEFGLCKQNGEIKAYGAGLLSAYGELQHALSDKPDRLPFDPAKTAVQQYDDQDYQPVYFVCESFVDMQEKLRRYAASIRKPYEVYYNPYTQTIKRIDEKAYNEILRTLRSDVNKLCTTLASRPTGRYDWLAERIAPASPATQNCI